MPHLYKLIGKKAVPCEDVMEWSSFLKNDRTLAKTKLGDILISTVFLGINHSFGNGPPLLFETMVFDAAEEEICERYSTWDQAETGHRAIVEKIRIIKNIPPVKLLSRFEILKCRDSSVGRTQNS